MLGKTIKIQNPIPVGNDITTFNKLTETYSIAQEIIENLDEVAIQELCGGYLKDFDKLYDAILAETYFVLYGKKGFVDESNLQYLSKLTESIEETLRIENINFFITSTMPEFEMNWHHLEWGEIAMRYHKACIVAARDHGKSYFFSHAVPIWKAYGYRSKKGSKARGIKFNKKYAMRQKGLLLSNEMDLVIDFMEEIKGIIEDNDVLRSRLYNPRRDAWASKRIKFLNGSRLEARSYGSSMRGRHPHYVIVDDMLKDNVLYSEMQRKKATDYVHSVVMNAVVPGGQVIVVGTPFHEMDLYGDLREKMKRSMKSGNFRRGWVVFVYPAIFPDGTLLWPDRHSYEDLMERRETQGSLIFSRELLVKPIVSDSSIFPFKVTRASVIGMEDYTFVNNRSSFPIKFNKIVTGCDFAMSATAEADFTVFMTFGVDDLNTMYLLHMWRKKGGSFLEQIAALKTINMNFSPDVIYLEANQFQRIFQENAEDHGLPVYPHVTGTNKFNLEKGLPGVAILFERNKIKFPRGDAYSRNMTDLVLSELSHVTWTEKGKLEGVGAHDDTCMALWISTLAAKHAYSGFGVGFLES